MNYSDEVVDHCQNPRNVGTLDAASPDVGTGLVGAPSCGTAVSGSVRGLAEAAAALAGESRE